MNIILLGKPGSGKGTISNELKNHGFEVLTPGNILRQEIKKGTPIGKKLDRLFKEGQFAPSELTNKIVGDFLNKNHDKDIVMDGYPRNEEQWSYIKDKVDCSIVLDANDDIISKRMVDRWVHEPSGRIYNENFNPPKVKGFDDYTGEALIKRKDDTPEIIDKRMKVYYDVTEPIVKKITSSELFPNITINANEQDIQNQKNQILDFVLTLKEKKEYTFKNKNKKSLF